MKALLLVLLPLFIFSSRSFAQTDDSEKAFELEEETVQIHDAEGEEKAARQEADRAEKLEREQKKQLDNLKAQKESVLRRSQGTIETDKQRISTAEGKQKAYQREMAVLNAQIKSLQDQVAKTEAQAKSSESAAKDDFSTLSKERQNKADLINRRSKAQKDLAQFTSDINRMKVEFARLKMETNELEGHLRLVEQAAAKQAAERDRLARDIAATKQRKAAAEEAIRQKNGSQ